VAEQHPDRSAVEDVFGDERRTVVARGRIHAGSDDAPVVECVHRDACRCADVDAHVHATPAGEQRLRVHVTAHLVVAADRPVTAAAHRTAREIEDLDVGRQHDDRVVLHPATLAARSTGSLRPSS
jgi:hypothetical protein